MKSPRRTHDSLTILSVLLGLATGASAAPATKHGQEVPTTSVAGQPQVERFSTALAAFEQILRVPARVLAFGEYHQTHSTVDIRSALARFTDEILPALAGSATDLVVETWVSTGACGAKEAAQASQDGRLAASHPDHVMRGLSRRDGRAGGD